MSVESVFRQDFLPSVEFKIRFRNKREEKSIPLTVRTVALEYWLREIKIDRVFYPATVATSGKVFHKLKNYELFIHHLRTNNCEVMFGNLEESIHEWESPFFHVLHEFEIFEKVKYRYDIHFLYKINMATKRRKSSSHIPLKEFLVSDISESGKSLEFICFCILRSEDIL